MRLVKLVALAFVAFVLSGCGPAASPKCGQATLILVRHAEKAANDPKDPDLSDAGKERAKRLAALLAHSGVTRLVATDLKRTQQTLAPLAEAIGKPVEVRAAKETTALAKELRETPAGAVVVVAHHSNGIPLVAKAMGVVPRGLAATDEMLPETEFGRVMVLGLGCDRDHASVVELSTD